MFCIDCKDKQLIRGIKKITCLKCQKGVMTNCLFIGNVCDRCSDNFSICKCCGKKIETEQGFGITCLDCGSNDCEILEKHEYALDEDGDEVPVTLGFYIKCSSCGQSD